MRVVSRNRRGQAYRELETLGTDEAEALRATWSRLFGDLDSTHTLAVAGAVLERVKRMDAWIACDCLGAAVADPPILYPREVATGRYAIVRTPDRAAHDFACAFFWEEGALVGHAGGRRNGAVRPPTPDFLLYRDSDPTAVVPDPAGGGRDGSRRPPVDSLARRLFYLIERAGFNRMTAASVPLKEQFATVRKVVSGIELMPGVPLADWFWAHTDWITKGWAVKRLRSSIEGWPANVPRQGFLFLLADDIDVNANVIHAGGAAIGVAGTLRLYAGAALEARKPYLVLASVVLDRDSNDLTIRHAYAHPSMGSRLVPVDSHYERIAANSLLWLARTVQDRGLALVIEKPLSDRCPDGQTAVRPDFEIHAGERVLVVETMGSADPAYRARKLRTHAVMQQLGPVYQDERGDIAAKEANSNLARFVFGWLRASGLLLTTDAGRPGAAAVAMDEAGAGAASG